MFKLPTADLQPKRFALPLPPLSPSPCGICGICSGRQKRPPRVISLGMQKEKERKKRKLPHFVHCQPPPTEADDRASRRCDGSHCDKLCMNNTVLYSTLVHGNEEDEAAEAVMRRLRLSFAGKRKAAFLPASQSHSIVTGGGGRRA
jgi:hypothetical protein